MRSVAAFLCDRSAADHTGHRHRGTAHCVLFVERVFVCLGGWAAQRQNTPRRHLSLHYRPGHRLGTDVGNGHHHRLAGPCTGGHRATLSRPRSDRRRRERLIVAGLVLKNVWKKFGGVTAVRELNLEIRDREFVSFLGPSGCGKTTTLNMIAGLENVTSGEILMDGRDLTKVPPRSRNLAMVFQGYALYPHMTVADNIGFALSVRNIDKAEIARRVADAAERLELQDMLGRYPRQLSGGHRQRVALGRAFVRDPHVFLLDEPLSNLDAVLRVQTRVELKRLFAELDTTAIYVTHDQAEAMTMSDRIAVFSRGELQQFASPLEIYRNPANRFVATFVGSPPMSVFEGTVDDGGNMRLLGAAIPLTEAARSKLRAGATYDVGLRPEDVIVGAAGDKRARVDLVEHLGAMTILHLRSPAGRLIAQSSANEEAKLGEMVSISVHPRALYVFDRTSGRVLVILAIVEAN